MLKRFFFSLLVIAILGIGSAACAAPKAHKESKVEYFGLKPLDGGRQYIHLKDHIGPNAPQENKLLVLGFFASWCKPCKKEIPQIQALYEKYKSQGLQVLFVNIDKEKPEIEKARKFIKKSKVTFPVLSDHYNLVARRYFDEEFNLPATFVVDSNGIIQKVFTGNGKDSQDELETEIRKQLKLPIEQKTNKITAKQNKPKPKINTKKKNTHKRAKKNK